MLADEAEPPLAPAPPASTGSKAASKRGQVRTTRQAGRRVRRRVGERPAVHVDDGAHPARLDAQPARRRPPPGRGGRLPVYNGLSREGEERGPAADTGRAVSPSGIPCASRVTRSSRPIRRPTSMGRRRVAWCPRRPRPVWATRPVSSRCGPRDPRPDHGDPASHPVGPDRSRGRGWGHLEVDEQSPALSANPADPQRDALGVAESTSGDEVNGGRGARRPVAGDASRVRGTSASPAELVGVRQHRPGSGPTTTTRSRSVRPSRRAWRSIATSGTTPEPPATPSPGVRVPDEPSADRSADLELVARLDDVGEEGRTPRPRPAARCTSSSSGSTGGDASE